MYNKVQLWVKFNWFYTRYLLVC